MTSVSGSRRTAENECREATAAENVSRVVTFSFFDSIVPLLDGANPALFLLGGEYEEQVDFEL